MRWALVVLAALLPACETAKGIVDKMPNVSVGSVSSKKIIGTAQGLAESFEEFTPEQEYYIGRAVAAEILGGTKVFQDDAANTYVNRVGMTLAQASDRPEVFGGYHFFILDTDAVNALAAPGAFIFITRGMLRCCKTEDALAAVLAHEIAHVVQRDGMKMVQTSKRSRVLIDLGVTEALAQADVPVLSQALNEIASELATTLVIHGYSRPIELESDGRALLLLARVGYDPHALADVLKTVRAKGRTSEGSMSSTHPDFKQRIKNVESKLKGHPALPSIVRAARFKSALTAARG